MRYPLCRPFSIRTGSCSRFRPSTKKAAGALVSGREARAGRQYAEAELNALLDAWTCFHDPATLRRELYNKRLLNRTAELAWRIGLMECFPAWRFDLNRLTCRNTHGDYFISQLLCADGSIDRSLLARCVHAYCRYGTLNDCDLKNLERLYLYQIAVCDYYGQYYASAAANRHIYLQQAQHATHLLRQVFG